MTLFTQNSITTIMKYINKNNTNNTNKHFRISAGHSNNCIVNETFPTIQYIFM